MSFSVKQSGNCTECGKTAVANVKTLGGRNLRLCEYHRQHYMHHMEQERKRLQERLYGRAS